MQLVVSDATSAVQGLEYTRGWNVDENKNIVVSYLVINKS